MKGIKSTYISQKRTALEGPMRKHQQKAKKKKKIHCPRISKCVLYVCGCACSCDSHLKQLAVCNNLILINCVNKGFHQGLFLYAAHIEAIYIIPNWRMKMAREKVSIKKLHCIICYSSKRCSAKIFTILQMRIQQVPVLFRHKMAPVLSIL